MQKPSRPKKSPQSIWLMLGSAVALSLGGWAAIITHSPNNTDVPEVVELPPANSGAPVPQADETSDQRTTQSHIQPVRHVRPMLQSRSSS